MSFLNLGVEKRITGNVENIGSSGSSSALTTYTFSGFSRTGLSYFIICVGGTAASARTISSVSCDQGGNVVAATKLIDSGSGTFTCGIFMVDITTYNLADAISISVTYSAGMVGSGVLCFEYNDLSNAPTTTYTEAVTSGDPITSATSRSRDQDGLLVALAGNQITTVTDITWEAVINGGAVSGIGGYDVTYGSRMFSVYLGVPYEQASGDPTGPIKADFNAAPTVPRMCLAYLT